MESASSQRPSVPWGSETQLHAGQGRIWTGLEPAAAPASQRGLSRPRGVYVQFGHEEPYLVEASGHEVLLGTRPHQPAIPVVLMGRRALGEEKMALSPRALLGGSTHLRAPQRAGAASWGQLHTQRPDLATKLGLSLCLASLCPAKAPPAVARGLGSVARPCPCRCPRGGTQLLVTDLCQLPSSGSGTLELYFSGSWPRLPASQDCREDQLRPHVIGTALPQSGVQIGGLQELLLPPDTARGPGRGPGAQHREQSLEGAERGPPVVLGLPVGRLPGPREERRVHTAGGPVPGAQAVCGGEPRGPEEMQTAPSQSPWPLEPETKDPVTKNSSPQTVASFLQASHDLLGNE